MYVVIGIISVVLVVSIVIKIDKFIEEKKKNKFVVNHEKFFSFLDEYIRLDNEVRKAKYSYIVAKDNVDKLVEESSYFLDTKEQKVFLRKLNTAKSTAQLCAKTYVEKCYNRDKFALDNRSALDDIKEDIELWSKWDRIISECEKRLKDYPLK